MAVTGFDDADRAALKKHGLPLEEAERQLSLLRSPPPPARLDRPCTLGDGILPLDPDDSQLSASWHDAARSGRLSKFVPASGAATRMFRDLSEALLRDDPSTSEEACLFRDRLDDLALGELFPQPHPTELRELLASALDPSAAGLADLPKGLLPFHRSAEGEVHTAFEEHLAEGARVLSCADSEVSCRLHFTVSSQHRLRFAEKLEEGGPRLEERYDVRFDVDFSLQSPTTDTVALDTAGNPFHDSEGSLVFRPGGHGSLIANLQQLANTGHDLVMIKNIDNILPADRQETSIATQRALFGLLARLEARIHAQLAALAAPSRTNLEEAADLLTELGHPEAQQHLELDPEASRRSLIALLERPLRVCGMVRNEGDPGGGPFWVIDPNTGDSTRQIVETAQIDRDDPSQSAILAAATHFNPVLLGCALRTTHGQPFELARFVDPGTAFLAEKSHEGNALRALEHPGLWNGAMAFWNTVFVEIPTSIFTPVKTFSDLLGESHRAEG